MIFSSQNLRISMISCPILDMFSSTIASDCSLVSPHFSLFSDTSLTFFSNPSTRTSRNPLTFFIWPSSASKNSEPLVLPPPFAPSVTRLVVLSTAQSVIEPPIPTEWWCLSGGQ
ncbi:hypothetical protein FGO68_gene8962 [Halteria grandinella]|uniref:Uncharacterized protein n=1 Tax=Halteria grandinella TaxID=5974 RepID=A0A8J8T648_HALGN|nr:hypothetical protein FGO68_gene8962 [Halteria grandinella]